MITIDGSHGEGGGQILRTALAFSTLTQQSVKIENIRQNRPTSGLKPQHLSCVNAAQKLCNAEVAGAEIGSTTVEFHPKKIEGQTLSVNIGTAGSVTLLLQSLMLPSFFADKKVRIKLVGGTDVSMSQPVDYFKNVFMPHLKEFCEKIELELVNRGYYPKGNGKIELHVVPKFKLSEYSSFSEFLQDIKTKTNPINLLEQGNIISIHGMSHASNDLKKAEVAERQAKSARIVLGKYGVPIKIESEYCETFSVGSGIALWAKFSGGAIMGADSLGARGKRAETVGQEAAQNLAEEISSKAPIDHHLGDQLLPFMALTQNSSIKVTKITNHMKSNIYVIEKFLGKCFEIKENVINIV